MSASNEKDFVGQSSNSTASLMSIWGVESIDRNSYEVNWVPDDAEEGKKLGVKNLSMKSEFIQPEVPLVSYDLAARAILKSWDGIEMSVVSRFYRKGVTDVKNSEFIDAIYDFYLILETWFGDGKWRGNQVKEKLKSSKILKSAFNKVVNDSIQHIFTPDLIKEFSASAIYSERSFEKFVDHIVDLRGSLHHHSEKNPKAWDPNKPDEYKLDAVLLHAICNHLILIRTWKYIDDNEVNSNYDRQYAELLGKYE